MSRHIDADRLIDSLNTDPLYPLIKKYGIERVIDAQPTADVRENVIGRWIDKPNREFCFRVNFKTIECNKCGYNMPKSDSFANNFCPNCGADMRGEIK